MQNKLKLTKNKEIVPQIIKKFLYQEIDGMWVFNTTQGFLSAYNLREIAKELDSRNKKWNALIEYENK